ALTSPYVESGSVLDVVIGQYRPEYASFAERLAALVAANGPADQVSALVSSSILPGEGDASWQVAVLQGIAQGIPYRSRGARGGPVTAGGAADAGPEKLRLPIGSLEGTVFDHPDEDIRVAALSLLQAHGHPPET